MSEYFDPLPADSRTLAHAFSAFGYETAFFGKWQLYERDPEAPVVGEAHARIVVPPERRGGFDFWEGFESGFLLNDPLLHGTEIATPTRIEGYQSDVIVQRCLRHLSERPRSLAKPRFTVISLDAPHPPYAAPAAGCVAPDPDSLRLLQGTTTDPQQREIARKELSGYYSHIEATDRAIGRLVDGLRSIGSWERQLFAFASAHGDMHGVDGKFRKGWPDEEAVRIPLLLLDGGGRLPTGVEERLLFDLMDLGPSLLALAGGKTDPCWQGRDLSAALLGREDGPDFQQLSMPSVPPFAKQCPFRWTAKRTSPRTEVLLEDGGNYLIEHPDEWQFEAAEAPHSEGRQG